MHLDLSLVLSVGIQILVCCSSIYIIIFQIPVKPTLCNLLLILSQKMLFKNFNTLNVIYNNKTCQWQKNSNTKQQNYSFLYLFVLLTIVLLPKFVNTFIKCVIYIYVYGLICFFFNNNNNNIQVDTQKKTIIKVITCRYDIKVNCFWRLNILYSKKKVFISMFYRIIIRCASSLYTIDRRQ